MAGLNMALSSVILVFCCISLSALQAQQAQDDYNTARWHSSRTSRGPRNQQQQQQQPSRYDVPSYSSPRGRQSNRGRSLDLGASRRSSEEEVKPTNRHQSAFQLEESLNTDKYSRTTGPPAEQSAPRRRFNKLQPSTVTEAKSDLKHLPTESPQKKLRETSENEVSKLTSPSRYRARNRATTAEPSASTASAPDTETRPLSTPRGRARSFRYKSETTQQALGKGTLETVVPTHLPRGSVGSTLQETDETVRPTYRVSSRSKQALTTPLETPTPTHLPRGSVGSTLQETDETARPTYRVSSRSKQALTTPLETPTPTHLPRGSVGSTIQKSDETPRSTYRGSIRSKQVLTTPLDTVVPTHQPRVSGLHHVPTLQEPNQTVEPTSRPTFRGSIKSKEVPEYKKSKKSEKDEVSDSDNYPKEYIQKIKHSGANTAEELQPKTKPFTPSIPRTNYFRRSTSSSTTEIPKAPRFTLRDSDVSESIQDETVEEQDFTAPGKEKEIPQYKKRLYSNRNKTFPRFRPESRTLEDIQHGINKEPRRTHGLPQNLALPTPPSTTTTTEKFTSVVVPLKASEAFRQKYLARLKQQNDERASKISKLRPKLQKESSSPEDDNNSGPGDTSSIARTTQNKPCRYNCDKAGRIKLGSRPLSYRNYKKKIEEVTEGARDLIYLASEEREPSVLEKNKTVLVFTVKPPSEVLRPQIASLVTEGALPVLETTTDSVELPTTASTEHTTLLYSSSGLPSTRHRFSSRFNKSSTSEASDTATEVADIPTTQPPTDLMHLTEETPTSTLSILNLFTTPLPLSSSSSLSSSAASLSTTTAVVITPTTDTSNTSTVIYTSSTPNTKAKPTTKKRKPKPKHSSTPRSILESRPLLRSLANLINPTVSTTQKPKSNKKQKPKTKKPTTTSTTSKPSTTTTTTTTTTKEPTTRENEIEKGDRPLPLAAAELSDEIENFINETTNVVSNQSATTRVIGSAPRSELDAITPETFPVDSPSTTTDYPDDTTIESTTSSDDTTEPPRTEDNSNNEITPRDEVEKFDEPENIISSEEQENTTDTKSGNNVTSQYIYFDYSARSSTPEVRRTTTTTPSTSTAGDYFVYGIYPNNTVVRKRAWKTFDNERYMSPYVIFGIYPNNTIVKKFPNGTTINDEFMTSQNEVDEPKTERPTVKTTSTEPMEVETVSVDFRSGFGETSPADVTTEPSSTEGTTKEYEGTTEVDERQTEEPTESNTEADESQTEESTESNTEGPVTEVSDNHETTTEDDIFNQVLPLTISDTSNASTNGLQVASKTNNEAGKEGVFGRVFDEQVSDSLTSLSYRALSSAPTATPVMLTTQSTTTSSSTTQPTTSSTTTTTSTPTTQSTTSTTTTTTSKPTTKSKSQKKKKPKPKNKTSTTLKSAVTTPIPGVFIVTPEPTTKKTKVKFVTLTPGVVVTTDMKRDNDIITMSSQHVQKVTKAPANIPQDFLTSVFGRIEENASSPIPDIIQNAENELKGDALSVSLAKRIIALAVERAMSTTTEAMGAAKTTSPITSSSAAPPTTTTVKATSSTSKATTVKARTSTSTQATTVKATASTTRATTTTSANKAKTKKPAAKTTKRPPSSRSPAPEQANQTTTTQPSKTTVSLDKVSGALSVSDQAILEAIIKQQAEGGTTNNLEQVIENQIRLAEDVRKASRNVKKKQTKKKATTTTTTQRPPLNPLGGWLFNLFGRSPSSFEEARPAARTKPKPTAATTGTTPDPFAEQDESDNQTGSRSARGELVTAAIGVTQAVSRFMGSVITNAAQSFQSFVRGGLFGR